MGSSPASRPAKILIVDDDAGLLDVLGLAIREAGYEVLRADDGLVAATAIREKAPDLVICDVNLPRLDGFSLLKKLRAANEHVPFIMLTSREGEIDEALGFELGAQDYISKPFSTRVLLARVAALLHREELRKKGGSSPGTSAPPIRVGRLELDPERLAARYDRVDLKLTVTEFKLLEALARRPGVVFSREQLLDLTRGDESVVVDRIIDTYVRRLRRTFEEIDPGFACIETVIGAGYRWRSG